MKSANPKELITFAQQLHDSVSKLAQGEKVSKLSSQGNIRFMMMKLTPHLQIKWGAKCYDALPRVFNLVEMDDWLTKKSKRQQYGKLLCGGVSNDNESSTQQQKTQRGKRKPQPATSTINHVEMSRSSPTKATTTGPASTTKPVKSSLPPPICCVCRASSTILTSARRTKQWLSQKDPRPHMMLVVVSSARLASTTRRAQSKDAINRGIISPYFTDLHSRSRRNRPTARQQQRPRREPSQPPPKELQPRRSIPAW